MTDPWGTRPNLDRLYHEAGSRAPGESVYREGVDITDTVHPDVWPVFSRRTFHELGWRPWTPAGVIPAWWEATDQREATASPAELAQMLHIDIRTLTREPDAPT